MVKKLGLFLVFVILVGLGAGVYVNRGKVFDQSVGPDTGNSTEVTVAEAKEKADVPEIPEPAHDEVPVLETPDQYARDQLAYLAEHAKTEGVVTTESGLQFRVLSESGSKEKPGLDDTVQLHYRGRLTDGIEFDSSYNYGEPMEVPLRETIEGWQEGIQLMNVGDVYEFTIPPGLGYGAEGSGSQIPGFSVLIYEVELLDIIEQ